MYKIIRKYMTFLHTRKKTYVFIQKKASTWEALRVLTNQRKITLCIRM